MFFNSAKLASSTIVSADGDLLYTSDGGVLIDLFTAHGTAWLGHGREEVRRALAAQLERVWITGGMPTPATDAMRERVAAFLPAGYALASLASTGMEANEQALRIARVCTGRNGAIGLAGAMHGKSFATAHLAWDNGDGLALPDFERLPAGPHVDEAETLERLENHLRTGRVAAVYIEPIHGTSLGWEASPAFYQAVRRLVTRFGSLLVYDEVLTGFYRTGPRFRCLHHGVEPDVLVFGKACGNGFPVAGVAVRQGVALSPRMLLGSTFSNNALSAVAVRATIDCLEKLGPESLVRNIDATIRRHLPGLLAGPAPRMRGSGALWVIALETPEQALGSVQALQLEGVCVGFHGRQLRLLPSLTIRQPQLDRACEALAQVLRNHLPDFE